MGEDGWPREQRSIVASALGMYFAGLAFRCAFRVTLLLGAGRDGEHVAEHIAARRPCSPHPDERRAASAAAT